MSVSKIVRSLAWMFLLLAIAAPVHAATVTLAWDQNPEPNVTNYNVFVRTQSGAFGAGIPVGNRLNWTFTGLQNNVQYVFAVQAQSPAGMSGLLSDLVRSANSRACRIRSNPQRFQYGREVRSGLASPAHRAINRLAHEWTRRTCPAAS